MRIGSRYVTQRGMMGARAAEGRLWPRLVRHYTPSFVLMLMSNFPTIQTRVAGVSFENRDGSLRQTYVRQAKKGDVLALRREPDNPFDPYAMAVDWTDAEGASRQLGYVPRALASVLAPFVDQGGKLIAFVARKGGGGLRLAGVKIAIDLDAAAYPEAQRSGLEPAVATALETDRRELIEGPGPGLAPELGGMRRIS